MTALGPRVVVAGTHSGVGKTTIATGLMAALRARGLRVGAAKVGPDFIDPGYHSVATGAPSRNLDAWMCGAQTVAPIAARAAAGTDVLVVEGVMGLFDGAADGTPSSTAAVAAMLDAPVILVVDASSQSQSVAALVHGFATFDPKVRVAGLILNKVASDSHEQMLRAALASLPVPVVGVLRRGDAMTWRSRHLGLVPVIEQTAEVVASVDELAAHIAASVDLDAVTRIARAAPPMDVDDAPSPSFVANVRVAVAAGAAFSFMYEDNLDALRAAGADLLLFDPLHDTELPDGADALVVGGGFPEVFGEALAANVPLLASVRDHVQSGLVTWAECAGLLWLSESLDGHAMAGVVPTTAVMTQKRTLGYRSASTTTTSPFGPARTELRGHEYHYSTTTPTGQALTLHGREGTSRGGFATPTLLASYLHQHLGGAPHLAETFVRCVTAARPHRTVTT